MKTLIKFIESMGFNCELNKDVVTIKTGKVHSWVNGFGKTMTSEATIRIYKLESYKQNNYGVWWSTGYSLSRSKECRKIQDVQTFLVELLKK